MTAAGVTASGWRTLLVVEGHDLAHGHRVFVSVELIETETGHEQVALRIGGLHGDAVILPHPATSELVKTLSQAMLAEWLSLGRAAGVRS